MPLDPGLEGFLEQLATAETPPLAEVPIEQSRAGIGAMAALAGDLEHPARTEDRSVEGPGGQIPVRIYRPQEAGDERRPPVVVYFHGGGFVLGGITSHDPICHRLSVEIPAVVVSVEYRLAPEHPFPAGLEDCLAVTRWCADHGALLEGDPSRLAVVGDSAGGNLAAVVARRCRDEGPRVGAQVLVYPCTDLTGSHPSRQANGQGYLLTAQDMAWFEDCYLDGAEPTDPDLSPLLAPDLANLPPALVLTAEFDPLRDEGEAYADRLRGAGVPVTCTRYEGMIHGFYGMNTLTPVALRAEAQVMTTLRQALQVRSPRA